MKLEQSFSDLVSKWENIIRSTRSVLSTWWNAREISTIISEKLIAVSFIFPFHSSFDDESIKYNEWYNSNDFAICNANYFLFSSNA